MKHGSTMTNATNAEHGGMFILPVSAVSLVIEGALPSMKNSRRIFQNRRTGKPFSAKSDAATHYVADFLAQVPQGAKRGLGSKETPLRAIATCWWPSWRNDLDCSLLWDCLQLAGVIANDRWIREMHLWAQVDAARPRVEVTIELI